MTQHTITGLAAIELAEASKGGLELHKYADPTEGPRDNLTVAEARAIAAEDPSLIWIDTDPLDIQIVAWDEDTDEEWSLVADQHYSLAGLRGELTFTADDVGVALVGMCRCEQNHQASEGIPVRTIIVTVMGPQTDDSFGWLAAAKVTADGVAYLGVPDGWVAVSS